MRRSKKTWLIAVSFLCFSVLILLKSMSVVPRKEVPRIIVGETLGKTSEDIEQKREKKTLRVSVSMNPKEFTALHALSRKYEAFHQDVAVVLENVPSAEAYAAWKKKSQIGDVPDVMLLQNQWVDEFAALGYLLSTDAYFSSDLQSLQLPQVMKQVNWNGYIWAIPKDVDPYILAYNKAKAADWQLKIPPQNPQEFAELYRKLWTVSGGKIGIYWDVKDTGAFFSLAGSLGGFGEDDALLSRTIERMLLFGEEAEKTDAGKTRFPQHADPWQQLKQGNESVIVASLSDYLNHADEKLDFARLPVANIVGIDKSSGPGPVLKGRSFVVSSRSRLSSEAFDWIREMTAAESQKRLWKEGFVLPALISVYQVPEIRNDRLFAQIIPTVERGKSFAAEPEIPQKIAALQTALEKLIKNEATSKSVAEEIRKNWSGILFTSR